MPHSIHRTRFLFYNRLYLLDKIRIQLGLGALQDAGEPPRFGGGIAGDGGHHNLAAPELLDRSGGHAGRGGDACQGRALPLNARGFERRCCSFLLFESLRERLSITTRIAQTYSSRANLCATQT